MSKDRYFIATSDGIPLHAQPITGYTRLQVLARYHRECMEDVRLFGGKISDYFKYYSVLDMKFNTVDVTNEVY